MISSESNLDKKIESFLCLFQNIGNGFSEPVKFNDAKGFSLSKDRVQDGYDFVSGYSFFFKEEDIKDVDNKIPITIRVSYGEKTENGIRISPLSIKRKINWPLDLNSENEFFADLKIRKIFTAKGREISPTDLVAHIESQHQKPTKKFKGFWLRLKLYIWRVFIFNLTWFNYRILFLLLFVLQGARPKKPISKKDDFVVETFFEKSRVEIPELVDDSEEVGYIDFFGYKASRWAVVLYSIIHLIVYVVNHFMNFFYWDTFAVNILENTFLTAVYVIVSMALFEAGLPRFIFKLLDWNIRLTKYASFKTIKI